jgi:hypothetical protein
MFTQEADGTFASVPLGAPCGGFSVTAVDIDGDDDQDLVIGNRDGFNRLLANDGNGTLIDVAKEVGILGMEEATVGFTASDYDGDGDLDLFGVSHRNRSMTTPLSEGGRPNILYRNDGNSFTALTEPIWCAEQAGFTFGAVLVDVDDDADDDLYLLNDFGAIAYPNRLLRNNGDGAFTTPDSDLDLTMDGMGAGVADFNRDGLPDFALSDWGTFRLMLSTGDAWYDAALASGVVVDGKARVTSWGVNAVDMNNDSYVDIVSTFGPALGNSDNPTYKYNPANQPDALWLQDADGSFTEVAEAWGLSDRNHGRGVVSADLNGDGWLDMVKRDFEQGPTVVYMARCGEAAWMTIHLEGSPPNTDAIGARVDVWTGDVRQRHWVMGGGLLASSAPTTTHFGLGDAESVDRIEIRWPDGTLTTHRDLVPRQHVTVVQSEASAD